MDVTIAICTWNRARFLDQTLAQIAQLFVPQNLEWELLVVNNNSTDATDSVIDKWSQRLPARRLFEPQAGIAHARNRVAASALGDLVICTDDDVLLESNWLYEYVQAARKHPNAVIFGGSIQPHLEASMPKWLEPIWHMAAPFYGSLNADEESAAMDPKVPYGANFAVRRPIFDSSSFDTKLGRRPGEQMSGEETEFFLRVLRDGNRGCWVPTARVRHVIPEQNLTLAYLRRRFHDYGKTHAVMGKFDCGVPENLWTRMISAEMRYRVGRFGGGAATDWFPQMFTASYLHGYLLHRPN